MRFLLSKNFMHFSMNADKQIIIYYFHFAWLNQCSLPVTATNIQKKESVIFKHIIFLWKYGCFFCNAELNKDQAQYFIHSDKFDDFLIQQLAPN